VPLFVLRNFWQYIECDGTWKYGIAGNSVHRLACTLSEGSAMSGVDSKERSLDIQLRYVLLMSRASMLLVRIYKKYVWVMSVRIFVCMFHL
jgi:hypothetical protein